MVQRQATAVANLAAGIGVAGTALTLFAHSHPPLHLNGGFETLILSWQSWTRGFWDLAAGWTGGDVGSDLKDGLTLSGFLIVTALSVKRGPAFQERGPRPASLGFLEYSGLYILLTALFVAIPFDAQSDQFETASYVQFFLLLPVFAFSAAYAGRRQFFNALWVALASIGLLWLLNRS